MDQKYQIQMRLEDAKAGLAFNLRVFGDTIAEREGYKVHSGVDAVHFYIVNKYCWLPSVVRSMNVDDLSFLLAEEMSGWALPDNAK